MWLVTFKIKELQFDRWTADVYDSDHPTCGVDHCPHAHKTRAAAETCADRIVRRYVRAEARRKRAARAAEGETP